MKYKKSNKKCEICGSEMVYFLKGKDYLYQSNKKIYAIYKCNECGLERIFPAPTFNEISTFYPKNYYSYNTTNKKEESKGIFLKIRDRLVERHYERKPKKDIYYYISIFTSGLFDGLPLSKYGTKKFLDIGCGDGYNLRLMERFGWKTTGYEIGKKRHIGNIFYDKSFSNVNLKSQKYDYIRIWHVLEHVQEPRQIIRKIYKHTSDVGTVAIGVPNTSGLYPEIFGRYWYGRDIPRHLFNFNTENLTRLLQTEKFQITKIKHMATGGLIGSLQHLINDKLGVRLNLIDNPILLILFLPADILCNIFMKADVITILVKKNDRYNN